MTIGFEKNNNTTATYFEAIDFYKKIAEKYDQIQVNEFGMTDSGYPLHEVVISADKDIDPKQAKEKGKIVLFINNAIHPGEPCGVDASMLFVRDLLQGIKDMTIPKNVVIVIIPIYNIGGALNRNSTTRANQLGPESYGFRGNAKNLDLNRDFIKCDSKNARSFNSLFNKWKPQIFIDNHTSNGADYQYTMTLIATQKDKLHPRLSSYLVEDLLPTLYADMAQAGYEMIPYVDVKDTPDNGISEFLDSPRYSSGYGALHNCISFMPETHMLKPYYDRVISTYAFLKVMLNKAEKDHALLIMNKDQAVSETAQQKTHDIRWKRNEEKMDSLLFKGYAAKYKTSKVTGKDRLYYDRAEPYTKEITFSNSFSPSLTINAPYAYIMPQAYDAIIEIMKTNGVQVKRLEKDIKLIAEMYTIEDYKTVDHPYEGHYLHSDVDISSNEVKINCRKGDYLIEVSQESARYIVECLEPQSNDSYFAWNYFDAILMRKEFYSPYVFEDEAHTLLENDKKLKASFEKIKLEDKDFVNDPKAQLDYIYEHSIHAETEYMVYPVARIMNSIELD